ncbi:RNA polymerase subunit sigma-70 [Fusobacterium ulcerans]|uniref:RNA polymerase sigma factor SigS n=1 Tax=Fusobacterium ulcerans TaxID=861 RepID=A0AAX2JB75_9FUSO|nr:sigma-70 family RNA polymerase sigma factor [Fusobacterium ulcerans]AVQ28915.1 RNA polymerase subunit sigma-70 [Fusobacterium ulcerans]EFS26401.2 RNA polymerase sigma-H factor [Fusobacterium ulcerans ATCC 49185]SQJ01167.1 Stage 0 sporulation protein H [Fusobacterium ulcerans]
MVSLHLIEKAKAGSEEAIQEIFKSFQGIMLLKTKKYFFYGGDKDDVLQEAMIGLLKAINGYEANRQASFKTFAILCIKRQLITAIKSSNSGKYKILNMAVNNNENSYDYNAAPAYSSKSFNFCNPEEIYLSKEKFRALKKYLKTNLSKMENEIFDYMLIEMTYMEIADKTGRDPKSVDNAIQRIKKKLKTFTNEYDAV